MPSIKDGSETREGSGRLSNNNGTPVFEETVNYIVVADNKYQTRLQILQTEGLPLVGISSGPSNYGVCKSKTATRREDKVLYWDVTCEFSSEVDEDSGDDGSGGDPETWVPVYETKFERYQEAVFKDLTGKLPKNKAGYNYDTGLTITRHIPVWEFWQIESASISDETIIDRSETVNSVAFRGRNPKELLLIVLSSQIGYYYGKRRRLTRYQIKFNKNKWQHVRANRGPFYLDGSGDVVHFKGKDGKPYLGFLTETGGKSPNNEETDPIAFDIYKSDPWAFIRK